MYHKFHQFSKFGIIGVDPQIILELNNFFRINSSLFRVFFSPGGFPGCHDFSTPSGPDVETRPKRAERNVAGNFRPNLSWMWSEGIWKKNIQQERFTVG